MSNINGEKQPFEKWYKLDESIVGVCYDVHGDQSRRLIYSVEKMINIFMYRDGMTYDEAREYIDYNIIGAYVGKQTPIYLEKYYDDE